MARVVPAKMGWSAIVVEVAFQEVVEAVIHQVQVEVYC